MLAAICTNRLFSALLPEQTASACIAERDAHSAGPPDLQCKPGLDHQGFPLQANSHQTPSLEFDLRTRSHRLTACIVQASLGLLSSGGNLQGAIEWCEQNPEHKQQEAACGEGVGQELGEGGVAGGKGGEGGDDWGDFGGMGVSDGGDDFGAFEGAGDWGVAAAAAAGVGGGDGAVSGVVDSGVQSSADAEGRAAAPGAFGDDDDWGDFGEFGKGDGGVDDAGGEANAVQGGGSSHAHASTFPSSFPEPSGGDVDDAGADEDSFEPSFVASGADYDSKAAGFGGGSLPPIGDANQVDGSSYVGEKRDVDSSSGFKGGEEEQAEGETGYGGEEQMERDEGDKRDDDGEQGVVDPAEVALSGEEETNKREGHEASTKAVEEEKEEAGNEQEMGDGDGSEAFASGEFHLGWRVGKDDDREKQRGGWGDTRVGMTDTQDEDIRKEAEKMVLRSPPRSYENGKSFGDGEKAEIPVYEQVCVSFHRIVVFVVADAGFIYRCGIRCD